jgi:hypothetical protein
VTKKKVSSLKQDFSEPTLATEDEGLGLENASFRWNKVEEAETKGKSPTPDSTPQSESSSLADASTILDNDEDPRFELKDVSVLFPENKLSLITGPTARYAPSTHAADLETDAFCSGKTALLVRR